MTTDVPLAFRQRRALLAAIALLALPSGVAAVAVILLGDRVTYPAATASVTVLAAWAFIGGGLVAWATRPDNRTGALMVLTGFLLLAGSLSDANGALAFTVGLVAGPVAQAVFAHLLLAFPQGRLHSRSEQALVIAAYLDVTVVQLVMLAFMDYREVRGCPCPTNLLFVATDDTLHESLMTAQRAVGVALAVGVVVVTARRWWNATQVLRRSLAPVLSTGAIAVVLAGASLVVAEFSDAPAGTYLGLAATLAVAFVPLGFLVGLLRSRLARSAVGDLVIALGHQLAPGQLRGALARALGDPSLDLAYRLPDGEVYVDLEGHAVDLPPGGGSRAVTYVERGGHRIAAAIHDASLLDDPSLVESACAAAGLALENAGLQAELRARLVELEASRTRLVEATVSERRRIERDLHDGTQQRLVSIAMSLGLLDARLPDDPQGAKPIVRESREALSAALTELRELTQGIYPSILTELGLPAALEDLCSRAAVPTLLSTRVDHRLPDQVEIAAYYVVSEALTNAAKHSRSRNVSVAATFDGAQLRVEVRDDGSGGARVEDGSGLRGLSDRVEALGGWLSVTSPAGQGTIIRAGLPCE
ncbi:sensor histidine kinase [Sinomonas sp. P47F7]|uniref:sensor histidine kinase n=1 Tax=Sinomonas sp. P47F7 TaxID=3410987 RepID=UPI003BF5847D